MATPEEKESSAMNNSTSSVNLDSPGMATGSRTEQLYNQHARYLKKMEQRQKDLVATSCTFSPQVNRRRLKGSSSEKVSRKARLKNLYEDAAKREKALETKREKSKVDPQCTFTPKTNKYRRRSKGLSAEKDQKLNASGKGRLMQLYEDAHQREKNLEGKRKKYAALPFSPKINKFQSWKGRESNVVNRLYNPEKFRHDKEEREAERVRHELQACTFKPHLSTKTGKWADHPNGLVASNRLYHDAEVRREKHKKEVNDEIEKEKETCTFSPKINKAQNDSGTVESPMHAANRLFHDAEKMRARVKDLQKQFMHSYSFRPHINKRSLKLASKHTSEEEKQAMHAVDGTHKKFDGHQRYLDHLYSMGKLQQERRRLIKDYKLLTMLTKEEEAMEECTFHPKTNAHKLGLNTTELRNKREADAMEREKTRLLKRDGDASASVILDAQKLNRRGMKLGTATASDITPLSTAQNSVIDENAEDEAEGEIQMAVLLPSSPKNEKKQASNAMTVENSDKKKIDTGDTGEEEDSLMDKDSPSTSKRGVVSAVSFFTGLFSSKRGESGAGENGPDENGTASEDKPNAPEAPIPGEDASDVKLDNEKKQTSNEDPKTHDKTWSNAEIRTQAKKAWDARDENDSHEETNETEQDVNEDDEEGGVGTDQENEEERQRKMSVKDHIASWEKKTSASSQTLAEEHSNVKTAAIENDGVEDDEEEEEEDEGDTNDVANEGVEDEDENQEKEEEEEDGEASDDDGEVTNTTPKHRSDETISVSALSFDSFMQNLGQQDSNKEAGEEQGEGGHEEVEQESQEEEKKMVFG
eukprot:g2311.t1